MKQCNLMTIHFAIVATLSLLVGCSWKESSNRTSSAGQSLSTLQYVENTKKKVMSASESKNVMHVCYHFNISDRVTSGQVEGYHQLINKSGCNKGPWTRTDLNEVRDGIFHFPFEMLTDLPTRTAIRIGRNEVKKSIAEIISEVIKHPERFSLSIPALASLSNNEPVYITMTVIKLVTCQEPEIEYRGGRKRWYCDSPHWEGKYDKMKMSRMLRSSGNQKDLLRIEFR